jgi:ribonuclease Z
MSPSATHAWREAPASARDDGWVSDRELVVLGTASQRPTRERNHNGYLLLWDDEGILVDPGEGTQRQLLLSGVRTTRITHICLTHLHGDHCLGLPGVLARLSQCQLRGPVFLHFPASGAGYVERLLTSSISDLDLDLRLNPASDPGVVVDQKRFRLRTERLDHSADAMGWRVEDPPRRHLLPDRLLDLGICGSSVQTLVDEGQVRVGDRVVHIDEVSEIGEPHIVAFVFDTRWCDGAVALARDANLLVCESTFLDVDADLARDFRHMTARQAGELAALAGAHRLVLTHFSGRYPDAGPFLIEAARWFPDVVLAEDLLRIPLPRPPRPDTLGPR